MSKRFNELAYMYRHETDIKRIDAALFCLRNECADLGHAYNDQGVCEWCGEIHGSLPEHIRIQRKLNEMANAITARIGTTEERSTEK